MLPTELNPERIDLIIFLNINYANTSFNPNPDNSRRQAVENVPFR